ncbi:amidase family protein [Altererythrobacter sp. MF3-039]|uniref:amidase family protein n=1 Tax=Altererythrobacter sp. MF3-039 TaxID=3252901 RepID=UPI00390CD713
MTYPKLTEEPGAIELAAQIKAGELSPLEAVDAAIARIEAGDGEINAVVVRDFERARETAAALDGQSPSDKQPLLGVPMTVKESFNIAGLQTTHGYAEHEGFFPKEDSHVASALKAGGAVIIGKTNVPTGLADWQSFNPVYGRTRNPHDTSKSAGGSSGGSAAAVAAGFVPCDYGTDIGGSVRVPAHFNGVFGHKLSWGLVSKRGHQYPGFGHILVQDGPLSVPGPFARNAADLDLLVRLTASMPLKARPKPLRECRLLYLAEHPVSELDASVREPIDAAVPALEAEGVAIDRQTDLLPDLAAMNADYIKMLNISMARGEPAPNGAQPTAADWFKLVDSQARCEAVWAELFEKYDFVLAAPAPILAFPHRDEAVFKGDVPINGTMRRAADGLAWSGLAIFPQLPSTCMPVGETDGLPCGMQVIGPYWRDLDCIAAAAAIAEILHG